VPFGDTKKREKSSAKHTKDFFEKNGPNNPHFEGGENTKVIIFRQQVPAYLEHRLEPIAKFG
jgi:hypothetical protein